MTSITLPTGRAGPPGQVDVSRARGWLEQRPHLSVFVQMIITVVLILAIWPAQFGGRFAVTIVAGNSMEPTYMLGDAVVTWKEPAGVGDVVLFRVPEGEFGEGNLVIHRVVGHDGSGWVTKGDNSYGRDTWTISDNDILGVAKFDLPHSGRVLAITRSWVFIAGLGGLAIAMFIWPDNHEPRPHSRAPYLRRKTRREAPDEHG